MIAAQPLGSPADVVDEQLAAGELAALKITNQLLLAVGRAGTLTEVPDIVGRAATLVDEAPLADAIYIATAKAAMLGADDSDIEAEDDTVIAPDRFARWGGCPVHHGSIDGEPDPCSGDLRPGIATASRAINVCDSKQGPALLATEPPSPATPATSPGSAFGVDAAESPCLDGSRRTKGSSPRCSRQQGRLAGASDLGVDAAAERRSREPSAALDAGQPAQAGHRASRIARVGQTRKAGQAVKVPGGSGRERPAPSAADGSKTPRGEPLKWLTASQHSGIAAAARAGRPGSKSFTDAVVEFRGRGAVTRDVFDAMTAEERARSFTVARMLTDQGVAVVQDELTRAIEAGESLRKFRVNLRQRMQSSGIAIAPHWRSRGDEATLDALDASHVETVYRNGVMSAYSAGRAKHMTQPHIVAARPYWQVMTVNDGPPRQRPTHRAVHGWVMRADDPGWQTTYAPLGHNCFLPGVLLQGGFLGGSRALYAGKAIELRTAKGRRLTVTSQHPVLTTTGLREAALLRQGDQLICYGSEAEHRAILAPLSRGQLDKYEQPAAANNVFRALADASEGLWADAGSHDFHGEAKRFHGQVHVVGSYGQLQNEAIGMASGQMAAEFGHQLPLIPPNSVKAPLVRSGSLGHFRSRPLSPRGRLPGARALPLNDLAVVRPSTPLRPLELLRRGPAADLDARLPEAIGQAWPGYSAFLGQLFHAGAGTVCCDEVVEVREFDFLGHVYDFETKTGWIVADGIFTSNCRCRTIVRSAKWVERNSPRMHSGPLPKLPDPGWTCRPPPAVTIPAEPPPKPDTKAEPPLQPRPSHGPSLLKAGDEQLDNETRAALERLDSLDKDDRGRISMRALGFVEQRPDDAERIRALLKLRGAALDDAFARAAAEPMASYEIATAAAVDGEAAAAAARAWDSSELPRVLRIGDSYHLLDGDAVAAAQASSARGLSPLGGLRVRVVEVPLNRLPKTPASRAAALRELGESTHLADLLGDRPSQARARLALQDILKGDGIVSRDNLEIRAMGERLRIVRVNVIRGGHAWTGEIEISAPVFEHAKAGLTAARAGQQVSSQQQRAISTLFHEEIHGASPAARSAYQAHGAALEEASAEILARRQTRKLLGLKPGVDDPLGLPTKPITSKAGAGEMAKLRAYEGPVSRLLATVARFEVAPADVEAALIRMRKAGAARYETPNAHLEGFIAQLPVPEGQARLLYGQLRRALRSTALELERSQWRGHDIVHVAGPGASAKDVWVYADTGKPVAWLAARPCGRCGEAVTDEGHDACLGSLPGVLNACCGHGQLGDAYVQLADGRLLQGRAAADWVAKSRPVKNHAKPPCYDGSGLFMGQNGGIGPVYELDRNDTAGAVRVYEAAVGRASEPELQNLARMLARLQDNAESAAELLGYFDELNPGPTQEPAAR